MARIDGTDGRDVLVGTEFRDVIFGYGGNDDLFGLGGNDDIYGGAGHDLIDGGDGDDYLSGGSGDDDIFGGRGHDDLYGGSGWDDLFGGAGSDYLNGGSGDDFLTGGTGQDFLYGGFGCDDFIFNSAAESRPGFYNRDVIQDFILGEDLIDLENVDARTDRAGDQDFVWDGYEGDPNDTVAGGLSYRFVGDSTIISGNTDSDRAIEFQIELLGRCELKSYDFDL